MTTKRTAKRKPRTWKGWAVVGPNEIALESPGSLAIYDNKRDARPEYVGERVIPVTITEDLRGQK